MNFRFDITKATEVACQFLEKEGGVINIMKLVKLVYLLDRSSIAKRGIPVVGGAYFSLPNGPITSEFLDLINSGVVCGAGDSRWDECISDRQDHDIGLVKLAEPDHLSASELGLIEATYQEHGSKSQWEIRDWCHENCAEWTPLEAGREQIALRCLARAIGCTDQQAARLEEEARELNFITAAFAHA